MNNKIEIKIDDASIDSQSDCINISYPNGERKIVITINYCAHCDAVDETVKNRVYMYLCDACHGKHQEYTGDSWLLDK